MKVVKFLLAAVFCLGLTILFPFTSVAGLDFVKEHGKLLLFVTGAVNVIVGGAILGGIFSKTYKDGFELWLKPIMIKGELNPTYGFGAITLIWNLIVILFFVQP
jgi:hypothetical protein